MPTYDIVNAVFVFIYGNKNIIYIIIIERKYKQVHQNLRHHMCILKFCWEIPCLKYFEHFVVVMS
jgi:hypothetical protein